MSNPSFYCDEHEQEWFKAGKMRSYAHPVKDEEDNTIGWCQMIKTPAKPIPQQSPPHPKPPDRSGPPQGAPAKPDGGAMSKDEWKEKDRTTRVSIHRQSASQRGVELVLGKSIIFNQMVPWIKAFETYYDTGEWPIRPLTGHEALTNPAPAITDLSTIPISIPKEFAMCSIHKMLLDKKTKDGSPAHEFTDDKGARHKCIPKTTSEI